MRRSLLPLLFLALACDRGPVVTPALPKLGVCATVYPLADVLRQVGGEAVVVDWIVDLGDLTAGFSLTSDERSRLTNVDVLLWDGDRTESWAAGDAGSIENTGKVVSLEKLPVAQTTPTSGYLWLDPIVVRDAAFATAETIARREPRRRELVERQAKDFVARLDAVLKPYPNTRFRKTRVMVFGGQFDALLDRFGIPATRVDIDPLRPTDDALRKARNAASEARITALLLPFDTPPGTVADLEARTGLKVFLIDHLGHPAYPGHAGYLEILQYNLDQLVAATGE